MLQFANATATGSSGSLVYQFPNNTQTQADIVLLTNYNGKQCTGPLYFYGSTDPSSATSLPLVDCSNQTQVQAIMDQQFNCLFVYSLNGGGCQLQANATIDAPNLFAFLDPGIVNALSHMNINALKVSINKPNSDVFYSALIGIVVSIAVILCVAVALIWWRLTRHRLNASANVQTDPQSGVAAKQKIEPLELDLFETLEWKADSPYTECSVCLEEYQAKQRLRRLWCGHVFHKQCVDRWLTTHRFCPLCRSEYKDQEA